MVSIIVINFNTFEYSKNCISSIYKHTTGIEFEIILVDQASAGSDAEKLKSLFPDITLIKNTVNTGFAQGNNIGIYQSAGEFILLLNSDTVLQNNAVFLAWEKMEADPEIGVISAKLISQDGSLQCPAERFPSIKTELREFCRLNKNLTEIQRAELFLGPAFNHETEREADWVWGAFFMTRRNIIEKLGGKLPEDYFMYAEDVDWCWKIKKLGYKIWYYPKAEIIHFGGGSMPRQDENEKYFKFMFPNRFRVVAKNRSFLYSWILYLIKAFHHLTLRTSRDFWKAGRYLSFLFGKKRYWMNIPGKSIHP